MTCWKAADELIDSPLVWRVVVAVEDVDGPLLPLAPLVAAGSLDFALSLDDVAVAGELAVIVFLCEFSR